MHQLRFPEHFSWIYFLNNQVEGVQNQDKIKNSKDEETLGLKLSNAWKGGREKARLQRENFWKCVWMDGNFQKKIEK